jgi:hypothetical protein
MMDLLFSPMALWFTIPALVGTGFLFLQILLGEIGGDADSAFELDADFDADLAADDPGAEFRIFSLQSVSAFAVGYGWVGLAAFRALNIEFSGSAIIGVGAGVLVSWIFVILSRSILRLQSSGNVTLRDVEGKIGDVYITIPPAGTGHGRIKVAVHNSHYEYNAVQQGDDPIKTHTRVKISRGNSSTNTVTVVAVDS